MLNSPDRITYRNGFYLNAQPVTIEDIVSIYEERRSASLSIWELYEQHKAQLHDVEMSAEEYQRAITALTELLGV